MSEQETATPISPGAAEVAVPPPLPVMAPPIISPPIRSDVGDRAMSTFATPPTIAGALGHITGPKPPAKWHIAVGIIPMAFGLAAMLVGVIYALSALFDTSAMSALRLSGENRARYHDAVIITRLCWIVGGLLGCAGFIGGLGVLCRKSWGPALIVLWAWLKLLYATPAALLTSKEDTILEIESNGVTAATSFEFWFELIIRGVWWLWMLALPIFIILWFRREKVRADMDLWPSKARM